ncbi:MAG: RNA polymerase sigma factor [Planctomycetales bacterium]|nr:RNA polymerase sigma factor [Planctomycetales bacterium]
MEASPRSAASADPTLTTPGFAPPTAGKGGVKAGHEFPLTQPVSEDAQLLRQASRGDQESMRAIIDGHQRAVYGFLRARVIDAADAEDLCQEVFLRCCSGRVQFGRATQLRPWLVGVARNVLREHVRRRRRSREVGWTELCLEVDAASTGEGQQVHEATQHLPQCLEELGPSARQALELRYGSELRTAEISARLGRSDGAVKLLMFRARQALKNCLDFRLRRG